MTGAKTVGFLGLIFGMLAALSQPATTPGLTMFGLIAAFTVTGAIIGAVTERVMQ